MIKKQLTGKHKGMWLVRIQPVDKITGKRISWPVQYAKTKREAQGLEQKLWLEFENGVDFSDANEIFADSFRRYVENRYQSGIWSKVTYRDWQYSGKVFAEYFGSLKVKEIDQRVVQGFARRFVAKREVTVSKHSMIARRLTHLNLYFKDTIGKSPVPRNALKNFFRQNEFTKPVKRYLFTDQEMAELKAKILADLARLPVHAWVTRVAILVAMETGMRTGEIQALRFQNLVEEDGYTTFKIDDSWSDYVNGLNGSLKSRQRGEYRICLPLSADLVQVIGEYSKKQAEFAAERQLSNPKGLMFINLHNYRKAMAGIPVNQRSLNQMLQKLCQELGIESGDAQLSMYSFRHTICTKLANQPGISYPWAAERMGHTLETFMATYVGVDRDKNQRMMAAWLGQ